MRGVCTPKPRLWQGFSAESAVYCGVSPRLFKLLGRQEVSFRLRAGGAGDSPSQGVARAEKTDREIGDARGKGRPANH